MKPSLRFLALAVVGWAGVRAAMLDSLPGGELFTIARSEAKVPPVVPTAFPPVEPVAPVAVQDGFAMAPSYPAYGQIPQTVSMRPVMVPVYYASAPTSRSPAPIDLAPKPARGLFAPSSTWDEWPSLPTASLASIAQPRPVSRVPVQSLPATPALKPLDRLQVTAWAMLRGRQGQPFGPPSLANGGQLGGSQAGARITYNVTRQLAATFRTSSDVGRRGSEVAAGVRVQPIGGIPLWLTAERRQRIGRYGSGRNAFAMFAESGVYGRPLPWRFQLDAYLQGGMVGLRSRDLFIDGSAAVTRPLFGQFSGGFGVWGAAQPGVYRLDAGPRVSMPVRRNMRVHLDWRQRIVGNAPPGSGPAVTLAGDF